MTNRGVLFASCVVFLPAPVLAQASSTSRPQIDCTQLSVDTVTRTATFQLVGAQTQHAAGMNFNGFSDGKLTLTVPQNWNVVIQFTNRDDNLPHSAEVIDTVKPMPAGPVDPSFPRAMTTKLMNGLAPGESDTLRFVAGKSGSFLIFCAVPGHGIAGMWIRLRVSPTERLPTLTASSAR